MKKVPVGSKGLFAMVDDSDMKRISKFKWYPMKGKNTIYAGRSFKRDGKQNSISMHRAIIGLKNGDPRQVDHADGNGLNNQRRNIETCTFSQNNHRRRRFKRQGLKSKYQGVQPHRGKWQAQISHNNKFIYIGRFTSEIDAARAYNKMAKKLFKRFAFQNRIPNN